jgi:hypothetical protein
VGNSVTQLVIDAVNKMAAKQGIKSLKVQNRRKVNFFPADWIAGVDYNPTITKTTTILMKTLNMKKMKRKMMLMMIWMTKNNMTEN